jgi:crotonobetainyl-CoA:carnitine CoA-transferase CaiB-like acyl-CoA transferase
MNEDELNGLIEQWTIEKTAEEIEVLLQNEGVPAGVVQNATDLAKDPQLNERKSFVELDHPILGRTITDNYPFRFRDDEEMNWKSASLLGQDNEYVFRELLGLTDEEYHSFRSKGIIS